MTELHTLRTDRLRAVFDPDGARLRRLHLDDGPNLVLDADEVMTPALRDCYGGTIVGPLANRVRGGKVPVNGVTHQMPCNENGITALHSGPDGLDRQVWQVTQVFPTQLCLQTVLADGDGGLPGNRTIDLEYAVHGNQLELRIWVTTDAPTPVSIAHHPYWRVAPDHRLFIDAAQYLPTDDTNLPTGETADVAGTPFDHRTPRPIACGTDHNFCVAATVRTTPVEVAVLETGDHRLHIASTEPGLQAYSGAFLPHIPEARIAPFSGIALEPQGWPDAVNNPAFPSVIVTPDHRYAQITTYTLQSAT